MILKIDEAPKLRSRAHLAFQSGLLLLVLSYIFRKHIFGSYSFPWDFTATYSASPAFVSSVFRAGSFTEWIPFVGGGFPIATNLQAGLYFPVWAALGLAGISATVKTVTVVQILHLFVGALGIRALAKARGMAETSAFACSLAYLFFGGFYGNAEHADIFRGHAYLPWLLWSLTIPARGHPWLRLLILPGLAWLIASGAYPGQLVAFAIVGAIYVIVELRQKRSFLNKGHIASLMAILLAAGSTVMSVVLPYVRAEAAGLLHRPTPPTVVERSVWAYEGKDLLGLYLNPFGLHEEGTIFACFVGIPALLGLTLLRSKDLRANAAVVGAVGGAIALAALPAWEPAGKLMASMPLLFPSRFPAADYKAAIGTGLIILSAIGWSFPARRAPIVPLVAGIVISLGLLFPKSTIIPLTFRPTLVVTTTVACVALALLRSKVNRKVFYFAIVALVLVDGWRSIADYRDESGVVPWAVPMSSFPASKTRDAAAVTLHRRLEEPPVVRPERVPPANSLEQAPGGSEPDALGYLGMDYHLGDFGGTILKARKKVLSSPELTNLMLQPWTAWAWDCTVQLCQGSQIDLPTGPWPKSDAIRSLHYGTARIRYSVKAANPMLMIENEFIFPGWQADNPKVKAVAVAGIFRGWVLPAGDYEFTSYYRQPERISQMLLAGLSLVALGSGLAFQMRIPGWRLFRSQCHETL